METLRHNAGFIVPTASLIMVTEEASIKRRQNMVRSLREAGASFEEIVAILRVGSQCVKQPGFAEDQPTDVTHNDEQQGTQAL